MAKLKVFIVFILIFMCFSVSAILLLLPLENINILAYNSSGDLIDNQTTDANGNATLTLIEYVNVGGVKTYYSNYTINASGIGWTTGSKTLNVSVNKNIQFLLTDLVPPEKISIISPDTISYLDTTIPLNYSVADYGVGIDSCYYFITNASNSCLTYDLNHDSVINSDDINRLATKWNSNCSASNLWCAGYDLNNNGIVDATDAGLIISHYGNCKIYQQTETALSSCENTTFSVLDEKEYILYLYANDTNNNINFSSVDFAVSTSKPQVLLDSPKSNSLSNNTLVYFNFTATQSEGLSKCILYGNWTGSWAKNYTWTNPINATMISTTLTLSNGKYLWNVWCNNTAGSENFALVNQTFEIDTISPKINITSVATSPGSQTVNFYYNITELNQGSCFYSIFNYLGEIESLNSNVSINCSGTSKRALVSSAGDYNLTIYAIDLAGNTNSATKAFNVPVGSTSSSSSSGGPYTIVSPDLTNLTQGFCGNRVCETKFNETYLSCPADCQGNLNPIADCFKTPTNREDECFIGKTSGLIWIAVFVVLIIIVTSLFSRKNGNKSLAANTVLYVQKKWRRR